MLTSSDTVSPIARPAPPVDRTPRANPAPLRAASDPCLSCVLPDCRENSPHCGLKAALRARRQAAMGGDQVPRDVIEAANFYHRYRTIEREAERADARRPGGEVAAAADGLPPSARRLALDIAAAWPNAVRRVDLIASLWGGEPPREAAEAIGVHLVAARKALAATGWTIRCEQDRRFAAATAFRLVRREGAS